MHTANSVDIIINVIKVIIVIAVLLSHTSKDIENNRYAAINYSRCHYNGKLISILRTKYCVEMIANGRMEALLHAMVAPGRSLRHFGPVCYAEWPTI